MSFDLFLVTFLDGRKATADAAAARAVLARVHHVQHPEFNAYDVHFEDGSAVEMYAGGLHGGEKPFEGGMFALRGLSEAVASFVFEFARAAGCVIFPAMEPACVLLPREDLEVHLPADVAEGFQRIPVRNGGEVLAALSGGYDGWRAYRDRVVGTAGEGDTGSET